MRLNYFNFKKIKNKVLLTNDFGKYCIISNSDFLKLINQEVEEGTDLWNELKDKYFIYNESFLDFTADNRYELRNAKSLLGISTSLHIFVLTTECNMACVYCQANSGKDMPKLFMTEDDCIKAVDIAFQSPANELTFEFQGGEPLLNFKIIQKIVSYSESKNSGKHIHYNLVSNLTLLNDDMLDYFEKYNFNISTSLDGHSIIHENNRPYKDGRGTYDDVVNSIKRVKNRRLSVGAIETTTQFTLKYPKELVHAYADLGLDCLFIRPLTTLGKATINWDNIGYTPEQFLEFYRTACDEMIKLNLDGIYLKENFAGILLAKMLGNYINYMELRSPCGAGIGQLAYYPDGNIYTCDEGRMLSEMGDDSFMLGTFDSRYIDLINNKKCKAICASSVLESIPTCCDCVYQPYCGTCPVINYSNDGDLIAKQPREFRCKIYMGILDYLFEKIIDGNQEIIAVLKLWSN